MWLLGITQFNMYNDISTSNTMTIITTTLTTTTLLLPQKLSLMVWARDFELSGKVTDWLKENLTINPHEIKDC